MLTFTGLAKMMLLGEMPRAKQALISVTLAQSTHMPGSEVIRSIMPSAGLHFMATIQEGAMNKP